MKMLIALAIILLDFVLCASAQNLHINANGYVIEMVYVKGGKFQMGSQSEKSDAPNYDQQAAGCESPVHSVMVHDFYIGKYEVTQKLWKSVMGSNPSVSQNLSDDAPVNFVTWFDVKDFVEALNKLTGKKFRLPSEEEWEFAARGGIKSRHCLYSGSNEVSEVAWIYDNTEKLDMGDPFPFCPIHSVGSLKPNELGIYDMSGNVLEWCEDCYYADKYYSDKKRPLHQSHSVRGGNTGMPSFHARVTSRLGLTGTSKMYNLGFRLVLD